MDTNNINWTQKAVKQLRKVADKSKRSAVLREVEKLASWPVCHANIKKLQNRDDYRLRVGDFRVIFEIDTNSNPTIVTITKVGKRDEHTY